MAKIALLIGVSEYGEGIPPLSSALNDVEAMQRVLQNPNLGGFEQVEKLLNPDAIAMRIAIYNLFKEARKDDLVLLFFSGHGITNDEGHLYLATKITAKDNFLATAVDANYIHGRSNDCYSRRQVLILDACYSGAYAQGWRTKSVDVDIKKQLGAEGRVVLTSSSATQTSFEQEGSTLSLYTKYLIEGIETGAADKNGDGNIGIHELHDYAKAKVKEVKPNVTPDMITIAREGFNIIIANVPKKSQAEYRKLIERYAQNGELSEYAYLILKPKGKELGIPDEKAKEIENEVLEIFRRRLANLELYKQEFDKAVKEKYPLDERTFQILKDYRHDILELRDKDVEEIEKEIISAREYVNNLKRYEQEFFRAVEAEYPISEYVRNGLKQFQQSLRLTDEDIEKIEAPLLTRKQAEESQKKQEYVKNLKRYEQEFSRAVQGEFPISEYVRNALKQFQQSLGLIDGDVKQVEERILAPLKETERLRQQEGQRLQSEQEEYNRRRQQQVTQTTTESTQETDDLSSEKGVDYTLLRDLLKMQNWKEADEETLVVMLKAAGIKKDGWLYIDLIEKFPCTDLRTIDQLWVKYSNGKYGFSVQKKIWLEVGEKWNAFHALVGWEITAKSSLINYESIKHDGIAPQGHLPAKYLYSMNNDLNAVLIGALVGGGLLATAALTFGLVALPLAGAVGAGGAALGGALSASDEETSRDLGRRFFSLVSKLGKCNI
ncbi:GUN4 domain protein [Nostoc sp. DSM 114161]|jgi:Arc/MetJ-type ribon-helix-helix transcriptional regulator|uniref:caspase, EACC1-associated type n=1 Tax=Nostoc sp. DSM 114161 TaxID=3440143 RepID=UPI004045919F